MNDPTATAGAPVTARAWVTRELGDPTEVLERRVVEVPAPGSNEARIAVEAFCLNFNDIDVIRGRYLTLPLEAPFVPGMESVGVVEDAGAGAEHLLGLRVVGIPVMAHGGYAEHAVIDAATALVIPSWMSSVDGAAMHYPFHLGWFALHERGRLQPGETVLVHAAAGGTGSGALQIAKALGAAVIAVAGGPEKVAFCRELGADHVVDHRSTDLFEAVEDITSGRGVDVAFDTVGGATTVETFRCMGFGGRHLVVGFSEDIQLEDGAYLTPRPIAYGNFDLCGVCLVYVNDPMGTRRLLGFNWPSRAEGQAAHARLLEMLRTGTNRTVVSRVRGFYYFPVGRGAMERGETTGRLGVRI